MSTRAYWTSASIAVLLAAGWAAPAHALSMRECSAKYEAAKTAGALNGMTWNAFRRAQCGAGASAAMPPPAAAPNANVGRPNYNYNYVPRQFNPGGSAVFPAMVSPKYANESPGKARMHTCLDQYRANKASGGNGNLRWIEKGGGYYSLCNKRLGGR